MRSSKAHSVVAHASGAEEAKERYGTHDRADDKGACSEAIMNTFLKIQNGSDIRGVALDGVEGEPITISLLTVYFIARAFASWLAMTLEKPTEGLRVSVGQDSRLSGPAIRYAIEAGLASRGAAVADFGMATTPAMFYSCVATGFRFDGACIITASHLPFNRNGMKLFTARGSAENYDIRWILEEAAWDCWRSGMVPGEALYDPAHVIDAARRVPPDAVSQSNFMAQYSASLRATIKEGVAHPDAYETPLAGMRILVDAGNGAGGFFAASVLQPLGADTMGSQFLNPDGTFPNHIPNPEDDDAMASASRAVLDNSADLGIVFDTDVDRSGIVDRHGSPINKNKLIGLMAAITLRQFPGTTIVTDSVTSTSLANFIDLLGGKHFRYKRGYKNVINKGIELNESGEECILMMETSGHGAMKNNRYLDDGAFMAVQVIIEAARRRIAGDGDISELLTELKEPGDELEARMKISGDDWKGTADKAISEFRDWVTSGTAGDNWQVSEPNYEGVRVNILGESGDPVAWTLLRSSLHDPLVVINVESDAEGGVKDIVANLHTFFKDRKELADAIDTSKLQ